MTCAICWEEEKATCRRVDHAEATRVRLARAGLPWSRLMIRTQDDRTKLDDAVLDLINGERHYLDGRPIHCGDVLLLQHVTCLVDDFGEYRGYLDASSRVRYEVEHVRRNIGTVRVPVMYTNVAGRAWRYPIDVACLFRWPERSDAW